MPLIALDLGALQVKILELNARMQVLTTARPPLSPQVKILELNARTTFSHYALAAQRRVPRAVRFEVLRVSEAAERPNLVYLTDPQVASMFVAVVEVAAARGETEAMQESRSRHGTGSGVAQHC